MALYAANNIASSIKTVCRTGLNVRVGGIIGNLRNIENEEKIIKNFADKLKLPVIQMIPRSDFVQKSEIQGKTVIEAFPDSEQAGIYFELADKISAK